jgi:glycosyltransferase involved in cell wall biosynthesis
MEQHETSGPMSRLRILVLGSDCHPTRVSVPYVTYSHAAALAQFHDVTLVALPHVEDDLRRAGAPFRSIEVVRMPGGTQGMRDSLVHRVRPDSQVKTACEYPFSMLFEWQAWRQLRRRIAARKFDVVLRVFPMSAVVPSPFAFFLRNGPIPFVIGPLNGGLPWPPGFSQIEKQKTWIAGLRNLHQLMPFARSTYRHAAAIIAASSQICSEFAVYHDKVFFVPEPGIDRSVCLHDSRRSQLGSALELIFVGGLIPLKACDLALRGAARLLRDGVARFTVVGDGPERQRLEQLATVLGIRDAVTFTGWLSHTEVFSRLRSADAFLFPSLKENGGGVVFEALASGAVPVVVDFGGPGDIVHKDVGYKVPLTNESDIVAGIESALKELASNRDLLGRLRRQGMAYARERLTWDAKAQMTTDVLNWVVGRGPKPNAPSFQGVADRGYDLAEPSLGDRALV